MRTMDLRRWPGSPRFFVVVLVALVVHQPWVPRARPAPTPPPPPTSNVTASDHLALLSFKSLATTGPALSSWNHSVGVCGWPGVTCGAKHSHRVVALSLDSLHLGGTISPSLSNLTFLRRLRLTGNGLRGVIPTELGNLRRLRYLNLSVNFLEGQFPESLSRCSNIRTISLRSNNLQGTIPANLSRCSNLEFIFLRNNKLTGEIPPDLGSLKKLQALVLSNNNFTGTIPTSFGNLSSLSALRVAYNNLHGEIPSDLGRIEGLGLIHALFNSFSGELPPALFNLTSLFGLGVGGNLLTGILPSDFGRNLPNLVYLYLYNNRFHGPIPLSILNATRLRSLEISNNNFTGPVPANIGSLRNLVFLQLGRNKLVSKGRDGWSFMTTLPNCSNLQELDLSNNSFTGSLPESIANLSSSMMWLRFGGNKITGRIPPGIGDLSNLLVFDSTDNRLSGTIPHTFGNLGQLQFLSLRINRLSGEIPHAIGKNLSKLVGLYMSENNLSGSIPQSFALFQVLETLDLSHNTNLRGVVPKGVLGISSLTTYLNLSHNSLTGPLPDEVGRLIHLQALDISENRFSGKIPASIGNCRLLGYVNLQGNNFSGEVPDLSNIMGIQLLDLSRNNLHGRIPGFLEDLRLLQSLNLSFNDFEEEVPTKGIFRNTSAFSVSGNERLCSNNPRLNLRACTVKKQGHGITSKTLKTIVIVIPIVGCCLCVVACLVLYKRIITRRSSGRKLFGRVTSWGDQLLKLSYAELVDATDGFSPSNLIGSGGSSTVYKGLLLDNLVVAVKVFDAQLHGALKSFMAECKFLRNIRHRNLVRILTSCSSIDFNGRDFKALVYEYMPNGSLESWLHADGRRQDSGQRELSLWHRVNVAVDIASALDYLHNGTETPIVHCDLKPGNVLLDEDMTAHVTDFGIARFLVKAAGETSSIGINGTIGYVAPECGMGGQISTLWDVYGYGVLLLEMFTGRRPTDEAFGDGTTDLRGYVESSFPGGVVQVIDPKLLPLDHGTRESIRGGITSIMEIALVCSNWAPAERMKMGDVVKKMDGIRDSFAKLLLPSC